MASLVNIIGGALQGAGAGVTALAAAAKEREGEAWRRAYQERVFGLQKEQFGLQQDQFAFNQEQAGIENERADRALDLQETQHSDLVAHRQATLSLEQSKRLDALDETEKQRVEAMFTTVDPLTGERNTDWYGFDAYFDYKDKYGEAPNKYELDYYLRTNARPELREFVRGREFDWNTIVGSVLASHDGESLDVETLRDLTIAHRDSLRALHGITPDGDPPDELFRGPGSALDPPTGGPSAGAGAFASTPTAASPQVGSQATGHAGLFGPMSETSLTEIGIMPQEGLVSTLPKGGYKPEGSDFNVYANPRTPGSMIPPEGFWTPAQKQDPGPPPGVRSAQDAEAKKWPNMDLTELGLFLRQELENTGARNTAGAMKERVEGRPSGTGDLAGESYSWRDIVAIAKRELEAGNRDRREIMQDVRDKLAAAGAKVPSGSPPR